MEESFDQYLNRRAKGRVGRGIISQNAFLDFEDEVLTFPLWSFTGQMIGYQQHQWKSDKKKRNDSKGRYWTYHKKEVVPVWGLEFYNQYKDLYIVEGIWDAISCINVGLNCIAVLTNNPKHLKNLFFCLPNRKIALCDGDKAGKILSKSCNDAIILPEGKDVNDLSGDELKGIVNGKFND